MLGKDIVPPNLDGRELLLHLRTMNADDLGDECMHCHNYRTLVKFVVQIKKAVDCINPGCLSEGGCKKNPEKKSVWQQIKELSPDRFVFFINSVISIVLTFLSLRRRKK